MILKIILWAILGYIVYSWFRERLALNQGKEGDRTIHHHHYHDGKKKTKKKEDKEDDYIDYEEV